MASRVPDTKIGFALWPGENIYHFGKGDLGHGGTGGDHTIVEQAFSKYWSTSKMALEIGALLPLFNRFDEFYDPLHNFLISRPRMSRLIGVSAWKDIGLYLHGFFRLSKSFVMDSRFYTINGPGNGSNLRGSSQYRDNNENSAIGSALAGCLTMCSRGSPPPTRESGISANP